MFSRINRLVTNISINKCLNKCLMPRESSNLRHFSTIDSNNERNERMERDFVDLSVSNFSQLITSNEIKEKIQLILSEYEYEKYTTLRVPSTLTTNDMKDLLMTRDSIERKKMINFLFKKEFARLNDLRKRREHSEQYWSKKEQIYSQMNVARTGIWDQHHNLIYGLWHNTFFSKIPKTATNRLYVNRLKVAALFGQKLVIDLDYDRYMKLSECRQLAQQLQLLYSYNKYRTREPFDLHFTNCDANMPTIKAIPRFLHNHDSPAFMSPFHRKSYLDLFPKERLVYLTPHEKEPLLSYNEDDIYIIGGFIDKTCHEPVSYVKAKKEGLRTARLPIDEYVLWGEGSKYLCLNHIVAILHDVRMSGDWKNSMRNNIPKRKQKSIDEIEYEDRVREQNVKRRQRLESYTTKRS